MEKSFTKDNYQQFMKGYDTKAIHEGFFGDQYGSVVPPIILSTTYTSQFQHKYHYSRLDNPTRNIFEENVAALEGAKHAIAFASGMAAITTVFHLLNPGDHFLMSSEVYGWSILYAEKIGVKKQGLTYDLVDTRDLEIVKKAIKENTRLIYFETLANPLLHITDIEGIVKICKGKNILVCIDNTFMSPIWQNPLLLGADVVIHSASKYIGGHSDIVAGVVAVNDDNTYNELLGFQRLTGNESNPFDCYLGWRGIKTLKVRMCQAQENAFKIAEYLQNHPKVEKVLYAGLPDHPGHEILKRQAKGFGSMISFYLKEEKARNFCRELTLIIFAGSFGGVESLAMDPIEHTHKNVDPEICKKLGINKKLVRMSIGIESVEDLIADISNALSKI